MRLTTQRRLFVAQAATAALGGTALDASAQLVTSRLKAADHHMLFLSTRPSALGILTAQGADWAYQHDAKFYLYGSFSACYIQVWVHGTSRTSSANHARCRPSSLDHSITRRLLPTFRGQLGAHRAQLGP